MFSLDNHKAIFLFLILGLSAACGGGGGGGTASPAPSTTSGPPVNVRASADPAGSVLVTWEAPVSGADGYDVQARVAPADFRTVNPTTIAATGKFLSFPATLDALNVPELSTIEFRVLGYKGTLPPGISTVASTSAPLLRPELALATSEDGVERLTLTNHSKVADHLHVDRLHSFDLNLLIWNTTSMGDFPVGTTSIVDDAPPEGSVVYYTATYSKGSATAYNNSNKCSAAFRPPSDLAATVAGQSISLSWNNHSAAATKIVVLRSAGLNASGAGLEVATLFPSTQTWTDTVPAPGYYTYSLEARTSLWASAMAIPVMAGTLPPPNGLSLISSIQQMPVARQALRGDSGAWYFAQEMHDGHPSIYLPVTNAWNTATPSGADQLIAPYLALDAKEHPHTIFRTGAPGTNPQSLLRGWHDGNAWQTEAIAQRDINASFTPGVTWRLDSAGIPRLIWAVGDYTQPQALEFAFRGTDGTWSIEPVNLPQTAQSFSGRSFQLFLDATDTPHLLVDDIFTVYHGVRTGAGTWAWDNLGDLGQGRFFKLPNDAGFGDGPGDFTLFLLRVAAGTFDDELVLLSRISGTWQNVDPVFHPAYDSLSFTWAKSPAGDRLAFFNGSNEGTRVVLGTKGNWTAHLLDANPGSNAFPAFDPYGHFHLLCQVSQAAIGMQVVSLNVLYDEQVGTPLAPLQPPPTVSLQGLGK